MARTQDRETCGTRICKVMMPQTICSRVMTVDGNTCSIDIQHVRTCHVTAAHQPWYRNGGPCHPYQGQCGRQRVSGDIPDPSGIVHGAITRRSGLQACSKAQDRSAGRTVQDPVRRRQSLWPSIPTRGLDGWDSSLQNTGQMTIPLHHKGTFTKYHKISPRSLLTVPVDHR